MIRARSPLVHANAAANLDDGPTVSAMEFQSIAQVPGGGKFCRHCGRILALTAFASNVTNPDGLSGWCRLCLAEDQRARRARRSAARRASA